MECEFCNNILKTKYSLNNHKKNNKKCLEIQKSKILNIESSLKICDYCNKSFSLSNINIHKSTCKVKKKKKFEELQKEYENLQNINKELEECNRKLVVENIKLVSQNLNIQELKDYIIKLETENNIYKKDHETISDIAKQPKTTNTNMNTTNNIINNLSIYDHDEIKNRFCNAINNIKPSDLYDGQKSIGRYVAPCLKNEDGTKMMSCTDSSRNIFVYKDKNGNINKDIKCKNLVDLIEPIATAKADELLKEEYDNKIKSSRLTSLHNQVNKRKNEIKELNNHLLGLEKETKKWKYTIDLIKQKEELNVKDMNEIGELLIEGIYEDEIYDNKLIDAVDDIKDMHKDSTKFSKVLSELV